MPDGVDANGTETFKDVLESEEIFALILERNFKHFGQANGTPFTETPFKDWLGNFGETETGQAILTGKLGPSLDTGFPETQTVLDLLQPFNPPAQPISTLVTSGDFKSFFAKWEDITQTSPSGKHLGHYTSLLSPAFTDKDKDELTDSTYRTPQHCSYSWKPLGTLAADQFRHDRKKSGNYQLNKLRTIHSFEVDYNWLLGMIFRRRMVHGAETQNH